MATDQRGLINREVPDDPEDILRLDGRRVSVFQIGEMHTVAGDTPEEIADQLSLSLADVHAALPCYYAHPDEMAAIREHQNAVIDDVAERSMAPEEAAR